MVEYVLTHPVDDVRLAMGLFYTDKEKEKEMEKLLSYASKPLP